MINPVCYNSAGVLLYSKELMQVLNSVNTKINRDVIYKTDIELYGKPDFWTITSKMGDCDDYCLTKRAALQRAGIKLTSMSLATCWTEDKEYHAVLLVRTDKADFLLDNRQKNVVEWWTVNYRWHKIQVAGTPKWRSAKAKA